MSSANRVANYRDRQRKQGRREVRLYLLDARSPAVRERIAGQLRSLDRDAEAEALRWIEEVNILDNEESDAPR